MQQSLDKYTVGISTPTNAGNPGDVVYQATPETGGTIVMGIYFRQ